VITGSASLQPAGCTKKCLSTCEKYNAVQKLGSSIADVLRCNGMSTFRRRVKVLQYLSDCWSQDSDVVVCAAFDNSDMDMQVEDGVTDDEVDSDAEDAERDADDHGLPDQNTETAYMSE